MLAERFPDLPEQDTDRIVEVSRVPFLDLELARQPASSAATSLPALTPGVLPRAGRH